MDRLENIEKIMEKLAISQVQTDAQMAETDKRFAETEAQMAETHEEVKRVAKLVGGMGSSHEETNKKLDKTAKLVERMRSGHEERSKELDRIAKLVGGIGNSHGEIAEEFFYNSLKAKKILNHITYDTVRKNITGAKDDIEDEYDIFMINGKDIAIIEVKYKAHKSDLDRLVHKKYENFKKLFPEYRNFKHHLALASFKVHDDIKEQAGKQGVMVLRRRGDVFETCVPEKL